jgi:isocitrate dehydrogenase
MVWARELADQDRDEDLKKKFAPIADAMEKNEEKILKELDEAQGHPVDVGGYYRPDDEKAAKAMRPSETLNRIVDSI